MMTGTLISFIGWSVIVFRTDPFFATPAELILFYVTLFLSSLGFFSLCGMGVRTFFFKKTHYKAITYPSLRQAFFYSGMIVVSLYLMANSLLNAINFFALFFACVVLEIFFTRQSSPSQTKEAI